MAIFGLTAHLDPAIATYTFLAVLGLLIVLEYIIETLEHSATRNGYLEILDKLKKELMLMGIISFTVFLFSTFSEVPPHSPRYLSFELAHIVTLFIALAFILQSLMLVQFSYYEGRKLLKAIRTDPVDLVAKYHELMNSSTKKWQQLTFTTFPNWLPFYPELRSQMEYKLIEKYFRRIHGLPSNFNFAKYINILFKTYISELGDVSIFNWFLLGCLVVINFIRAKYVDPELKKFECSNDSSSSGHHRRFLSETASVEGSCVQYLLKYGFACSLLMLLFTFIIYVVSGHYLDRIIRKFVKADGVPFDDRHGYYKVLKKMRRDHSDADFYLSKNKSNSTFAQNESFHEELEEGEVQHSMESLRREHEEKINKMHHIHETNRHKPFYLTCCGLFSHGSHDIDHSDSEDSHNNDINDNDNNNNSNNNNNNKNTDNNTITNSIDGNSTENRNPNDKPKTTLSEFIQRINAVYLFSSSQVFFKMVEWALLFQCFYISLWATQLVPLAIESRFETYYLIALTGPIVVSFLFLRLIISRTVMLQCISGIHPEVLAEVFEESTLEETIVKNLCEAMHAKFEADESDEEKRRKLLKKFNKYDKDRSGNINASEFRAFLGEYKIYVPKKSFDLLWEVIDFDLSGVITWDEVYVLLFPHSKMRIKEELCIIKTLRDKVKQALIEQRIPQSKWIERLQKVFHEYDKDGSDSIDIVEFKPLVEAMGMKELTDKSLNLLFSSIDIDNSNAIEFDELKTLLFSPEVIQEIESTTRSSESGKGSGIMSRFVRNRGAAVRAGEGDGKELANKALVESREGHGRGDSNNNNNTNNYLSINSNTSGSDANNVHNARHVPGHVRIVEQPDPSSANPNFNLEHNKVTSNYSAGPSSPSDQGNNNSSPYYEPNSALSNANASNLNNKSPNNLSASNNNNNNTFSRVIPNVVPVSIPSKSGPMHPQSFPRVSGPSEPFQPMEYRSHMSSNNYDCSSDSDEETGYKSSESRRQRYTTTGEATVVSRGNHSHNHNHNRYQNMNSSNNSSSNSYSYSNNGSQYNQSQVSAAASRMSARSTATVGITPAANPYANVNSMSVNPQLANANNVNGNVNVNVSAGTSRSMPMNVQTDIPIVMRRNGIGSNNNRTTNNINNNNNNNNTNNNINNNNINNNRFDRSKFQHS